MLGPNVEDQWSNRLNQMYQQTSSRLYNLTSMDSRCRSEYYPSSNDYYNESQERHYYNADDNVSYPQQHYSNGPDWYGTSNENNYREFSGRGNFGSDNPESNLYEYYGSPSASSRNTKSKLYYGPPSASSRCSFYSNNHTSTGRSLLPTHSSESNFCGELSGWNSKSSRSRFGSSSHWSRDGDVRMDYLEQTNHFIRNNKRVISSREERESQYSINYNEKHIKKMVKKVIKKHVREEIDSESSQETKRHDRSCKSSGYKSGNSYKHSQDKTDFESQRLDSEHSSKIRCKDSRNNEEDRTIKDDTQSKSSCSISTSNKDRSFRDSDASIKSNVDRSEGTQKDPMCRDIAKSCSSNNSAKETSVTKLITVIDLDTESVIDQGSRNEDERSLGGSEQIIPETSCSSNNSAKETSVTKLITVINLDTESVIDQGSRNEDERSLGGSEQIIPETSDDTVETRISSNTTDKDNDIENISSSTDICSNIQHIEKQSETHKLNEKSQITVDREVSYSTIEKNESEVNIECDSTGSITEITEKFLKVANEVNKKPFVPKQPENVESGETLAESSSNERCEINKEKKLSDKKKPSIDYLMLDEIDVENEVHEVLSTIVMEINSEEREKAVPCDECSTKESCKTNTGREKDTDSIEIESTVCNDEERIVIDNDQVRIDSSKTFDGNSNDQQCEITEDNNEKEGTNEKENGEKETNLITDAVEIENIVREVLSTITNEVDVRNGQNTPKEDIISLRGNSKKPQKRKCTPEIDYVNSIRELQNKGDENNTKEKIKTELIKKIKKHKEKYHRMMVKGTAVHRVRRSHSTLEDERSLDEELGVDEEFNKKYYGRRHRSHYEEFKFYGDHCTSYKNKKPITKPAERNTKFKITIRSENRYKVDTREPTRVRQNDYERLSSENRPQKRYHRPEDAPVRRSKEKRIPFCPNKSRREIVSQSGRHFHESRINQSCFDFAKKSHSSNEITFHKNHNEMPQCNAVASSSTGFQCCSCPCFVAMLQHNYHQHHPICRSELKTIQEKVILDTPSAEQNSNESTIEENKEIKSTLSTQCEQESVEKILLEMKKLIPLLKKKYSKKKHRKLSCIERHSSRKRRFLKRARKRHRTADSQDSNYKVNTGNVDELKNTSPKSLFEDITDDGSDINESPKQFITKDKKINENGGLERINNQNISHLNVSENRIKQTGKHSDGSIETKRLEKMNMKQGLQQNLESSTENSDSTYITSRNLNSELKVSINLNSIGFELSKLLNKTERDKTQAKEESISSSVSVPQSRDPRNQPRESKNEVITSIRGDQKDPSVTKPSPKKVIPKTAELINELKFLKRKSSVGQKKVTKKVKISKKETGLAPNSSHQSLALRRNEEFNDSLKKSSQSFKIKNDILDAKFNESFKKNRMSINSNIQDGSLQKGNLDLKVNPKDLVSLKPIIKRRLSDDTNGKSVAGKIAPRRHSTYAEWKSDQLSTSSKEVKHVTFGTDVIIEIDCPSNSTDNNHRTGMKDSSEPVFISVQNKNPSNQRPEVKDVNENKQNSLEQNERIEVIDEIITKKCHWGPQNFIKLGQYVNKPKISIATPSKITKGKRRVSRITDAVTNDIRSKTNLTLEEYLKKRKVDGESSKPSPNKNKEEIIILSEPKFVDYIKVEFDTPNPNKAHGDLSYSSIQDFILKQSSQNTSVIYNASVMQNSETNLSEHQKQTSHKIKKGDVHNAISGHTNSHSTHSIKHIISTKEPLISDSKESRLNNSNKKQAQLFPSVKDCCKLPKSNVSNDQEKTIKDSILPGNSSNPVNDFHQIKGSTHSNRLQKQKSNTSLLTKTESHRKNIPTLTNKKLNTISLAKTMCATSEVKIDSILSSREYVLSQSMMKYRPIFPKKNVPAHSKVKINPIFSKAIPAFTQVSVKTKSQIEDKTNSFKVKDLRAKDKNTVITVGNSEPMKLNASVELLVSKQKPSITSALSAIYKSCKGSITTSNNSEIENNEPPASPKNETQARSDSKTSLISTSSGINVEIPAFIDVSKQREVEKEPSLTKLPFDIVPKEPETQANITAEINTNILAKSSNDLTKTLESCRNNTKIEEVNSIDPLVNGLPILTANDDPSLEENFLDGISAIERELLTEAQLLYEKEKKAELANCPMLTKPSAILRVLTPTEIHKRFTDTSTSVTNHVPHRSNIEKIIDQVVSSAEIDVHVNPLTNESKSQQVLDNVTNTSIHHPPVISRGSQDSIPPNNLATVKNPDYTRLPSDTIISSSSEARTKSSNKTTAQKPQDKSKRQNSISQPQEISCTTDPPRQNSADQQDISRKHVLSSAQTLYPSYAQYLKDLETQYNVRNLKHRLHNTEGTSQINNPAAPTSIASKRHSTESQYTIQQHIAGVQSSTTGINGSSSNQNSAPFLAADSYSGNFTTSQQTNQAPPSQFYWNSESYAAKNLQNYRRKSYPQVNPTYKTAQNNNPQPSTLNASYFSGGIGAPLLKEPMTYNSNIQTNASSSQNLNSSTVTSSVNQLQHSLHEPTCHISHPTQTNNMNPGILDKNLNSASQVSHRLTQYVNTMYQNTYEGAVSQDVSLHQNSRPGVYQTSIQNPTSCNINNSNLYQYSNYGGQDSVVNQYHNNVTSMLQNNNQVTQTAHNNAIQNLSSDMSYQQMTTGETHLNSSPSILTNYLSQYPNPISTHNHLLSYSQSNPQQHTAAMYTSREAASQNISCDEHLNVGMNMAHQDSYSQNALQTQSLLPSNSMDLYNPAERSQFQDNLNAVNAQNNETYLPDFLNTFISNAAVISKKRPRTKTTPVRVATPSNVQNGQNTNATPPKHRASLGKDAWVLEYLESRRRARQENPADASLTSMPSNPTNIATEPNPLPTVDTTGKASRTNTTSPIITPTSQHTKSSSSTRNSNTDSHCVLGNVIRACLDRISPSSQTEEKVIEKRQSRKRPSVEAIEQDIEVEKVHQKSRKMSIKDNMNVMSSCHISDAVQICKEKVLRDENTEDANKNHGQNNARNIVPRESERLTVNDTATSNIMSQDLAAYDCRVLLTPLPLEKEIIKTKTGNTGIVTGKTKSKIPSTVKRIKSNTIVANTGQSNVSKSSSSSTDTMSTDIKTETVIVIDLDAETQNEEKILEPRRENNSIPPPLVVPSREFAPPLTSPPLLSPESQATKTIVPPLLSPESQVTKAIVPPQKTTKNSFYNMYNPCFLLLNELRSYRNLADRDENTLNTAITSIANIVNEMFVLKMEQNLNFDSPCFKKIVKRHAQASKVSLILILSYYQEEVYKVLHERIGNSGGYVIGEYMDVKRTLLELVWSARNIELEASQRGEIGEILVRYNKLAIAAK